MKLYAIFINTMFEHEHCKNLVMITASEHNAKTYCQEHEDAVDELGNNWQWASYREYSLNQEVDIADLYNEPDTFNDITEIWTDY